MGTRSFPGVKQPGHGIDHPHPSSGEVRERVELYLNSPSGPLWPVLWWTLPLPLLWNNHIDLLMKQLTTACYIIRNAKTYMSTLSLKIIYHAFFHSAMSYRIIFWGNSSHSSTIFSMQRKAIRIMEGCGNWISCRNLFKKLQILPLTSQYLLSLLMYVVQNCRVPWNVGNFLTSCKPVSFSRRTMHHGVSK